MTLRSFDDPNSIEARQALLDRRCERNHPKRHRTKRRAIKRALAEKQAGRHRATVHDAKARRFYAAVRDYWSGKREDHP